jgi:hypothetical protein
MKGTTQPDPLDVFVQQDSWSHAFRGTAVRSNKVVPS